MSDVAVRCCKSVVFVFSGLSYLKTILCYLFLHFFDCCMKIKFVGFLAHFFRCVTSCIWCHVRRLGYRGDALRIERLMHASKEGRNSIGCPIAKWVSATTYCRHVLSLLCHCCVTVVYFCTPFICFETSYNAVTFSFSLCLLARESENFSFFIVNG